MLKWILNQKTVTALMRPSFRIFKQGGSVQFFYRMVLVLSFPAFLQARESFEFYTNARSQAMGGVTLAMTSDETAIFRNPSNLGSFRGAYLTLLDPEIEVSHNFFSQVTNKNTTKAFELDTVSTVLGQNLDEYYHSKFQVTPSFVFRNFGIGLIYKTELSAIINSSNPDEMDTLYHNDLGAVLAYNLRLFSGIVKIGGSARAFNRIEVDDPALDLTQSIELKDIASEGSAIAYDASLMLQLPYSALPTLAVIARDISNTTFDKKDRFRLDTNGRRPQEVLQSVDVGFSFSPIKHVVSRSLISLEYRDVERKNPDNFFTKQFSAGFERVWRDIFYIRAGINHGYWSAGLELSSERWSWQVYSYGEEIGVQNDRKEDRRFGTKFSVRL